MSRILCVLGGWRVGWPWCPGRHGRDAPEAVEDALETRVAVNRTQIQQMIGGKGERRGAAGRTA